MHVSDPRTDAARTWVSVETLFVTAAEARLAELRTTPLPYSGRGIARRIEELRALRKRAAWERERVLVCRQCEVTFQARTLRSWYCSDQCRRAARRRTRTVIECAGCGIEFGPSHHRQRYCDAACRERHRRDRRRTARAVARNAERGGARMVRP